MTCGERRRNWQHPPSLSEMADMKMWARKVMRGFPSLLTVPQTGDGWFKRLRREEANARHLAQELAEHVTGKKWTLTDPDAPKVTHELPRPKLEAPPGMADDDPLILAGVYAKRR